MVSPTYPPLTLPVAWLDSLPESCVVLNTDRRVVYCNPLFAARYGHTPEELLGQELRSCLPGFLESALYRLCEQVLKTNSPQVYDETSGGSWRQLRVHPVPGGIMALISDLMARRPREADPAPVVGNNSLSGGKTATHPVDRPTPLPGSLRAMPITTQTILIVDDEPFMCDVAARALRRAKYQTRIANGGLEALDLLRREPSAVQLVLLDLLMPDLDGWSTLTAIRQIRTNLAVVLMGGQTEEEVRAQLPDTQKMAYLAKPYALDTLVMTVDRALLGS